MGLDKLLPTGWRKSQKSNEKATGVLSPVERLLSDREVQAFLALEDDKVEVQSCSVLASEIHQQLAAKLNSTPEGKTKSKYTSKDNELYQELLKQLGAVHKIDKNPQYAPENVKKRLEKRMPLRVTTYTVIYKGVAVATLKDKKISNPQANAQTRPLRSVIQDTKLQLLPTDFPIDVTNPEVQQGLTLQTDAHFEETSLIPYQELFTLTEQLEEQLLVTQAATDKKIEVMKNRLKKRFPEHAHYFDEHTPEAALEAKFNETIRSFKEAIGSVESHAGTRNVELKKIMEKKAQLINELDNLLLDTNQKVEVVRAFETSDGQSKKHLLVRWQEFLPFTKISAEAYQQLRDALHDISPKESILLTREHEIDVRRVNAGMEIGARGTGPFQHDVDTLAYLNTLTAFKNIEELPDKPLPKLDPATGDLILPQTFGPNEESVKTRFFDILKQIATQDQLYLRTLLGDTYLDLFHKIADENLFGPNNENMFVDQYTLMVMFSSMVGNYSALRIDRQLAKIFLIDNIQKRRARDPELSAKSRSLGVEVVVTAMSGVSEMLGIPGTSEHFTELTKRFWWLEVGRQDIIFAKNEVEEEEESQVSLDVLGRPIVEDLVHHENLGSDLSSEYGKYVWRRSMNESSKRVLHAKNQDTFVSNVVFRQLEAMRDGRREHPDGQPKKPKEMGITEVPLPTFQDYFVVVTVGNLWKKIKVPNTYFQTNDSITHSTGLQNTQDHARLRENFHAYLQEQLRRDDLGDDSSDPSEWQPIPTGSVEASYQKTDGHTESYQEQKHRFSDYTDYTAAHLRISLVEDDYLNSAEELQNSILTCSFSGRTQESLVLGFKDGKYQRMAAGLSHRNIDGQNTRTEATSVVSQAFEDTVDPHYFRLLKLKKCVDEGKPIPTELQQMHLSLEAAARSAKVETEVFLEMQFAAVQNQENKPTVYQSLLESQKAPKVETPYDSRIIEGVIPKSMKLRERANAIFAFYNKKLGMHPDKNVITQFAMMMTMDREDSHFLESDEGILCPALCLFPERVQEAVKDASRNPDDIFTFLSFAEIMKLDRLAIEKGRGVIRVLAMLSGAHGSSMAERQGITVMGKILNNKVTNPLTSSFLLSAVSGTREALPKGLVDDQDMFTTALEEVYPHGAWALSDVGEDITFSYRCLKESPLGKKWKDAEAFQNDYLTNLELILQFLEQGFKESDTSPPSVLGSIPDQSDITKLLPSYSNEQRQSWRTTAWRKRWGAKQTPSKK